MRSGKGCEKGGMIGNPKCTLIIKGPIFLFNPIFLFKNPIFLFKSPIFLFKNPIFRSKPWAFLFKMPTPLSRTRYLCLRRQHLCQEPDISVHDTNFFVK